MTITKELKVELDSLAVVCRVFFTTGDGTPMKLEYMNNGPELKQFVKDLGEWKVILNNADVGVKFKPLRWNNYEEEWNKIKYAFFATFCEVLGSSFGEENKTMTPIKISPLDADSYVATSEDECRNDDEKEAFRQAMTSDNGNVIYNRVLAVRMAV